jgi:tetratricopeptide (TPR) repeat protein
VTPEPEPGDDDFLASLAEMERRIAADAHAFTLLGVELDAGKREVKHAFSELSRRFHPDALQSRGLGHLRDRVSRVFAALSEAQMVLSDPEKRDQLRDAVEHGVTTSSGADATATARVAFESDLLAREGDKLLRGGRIDRALDQFRRALRLTPDEPDLQAAVTWCAYLQSAKARNDGVAAERQLASILKEAPNVARAHYFRGMVLKDLGAIDPAINSFQRAIDLDPRLVDAERHARILRATKQEQAKSGRGLGGLFGGKKS